MRSWHIYGLVDPSVLPRLVPLGSELCRHEDRAMEAMEGREQILEEEAQQMVSMPGLSRTLVSFRNPLEHRTDASWLSRAGAVPVRRWHCKAPRVPRSSW